MVDRLREIASELNRLADNMDAEWRGRDRTSDLKGRIKTGKLLNHFGIAAGKLLLEALELGGLPKEAQELANPVIAEAQHLAEHHRTDACRNRVFLALCKYVLPRDGKRYVHIDPKGSGYGYSGAMRELAQLIWQAADKKAQGQNQGTKYTRTVDTSWLNWQISELRKAVDSQDSDACGRILSRLHNHLGDNPEELLVSGDPVSQDYVRQIWYELSPFWHIDYSDYSEALTSDLFQRLNTWIELIQARTGNGRPGVMAKPGDTDVENRQPLLRRTEKSGGRIQLLENETTVIVDGERLKLPPHWFQIVKGLYDAAASGEWYVTGEKLQTCPGCSGKNIYREICSIRDKHPQVGAWIKGERAKGYRLTSL